MTFSQALRERRTRRQLSQLDLAVRAQTTQRHVSFMESGRSAPGRAMVVRLAESLELPLRERNDLLLAAGYAPAYPQTALDDPALAPVRAALEHILAGHLPYPAIIIDRHGGLVAANAALGLLTEGVPAGLRGPDANVYRLALHPDGMAARIENLAEWSRHILERMSHELQRNPDDRLAELTEYAPDQALPPDRLGFAVPPGPPYVAADRVAALHAAIGADDEPAILVAHSAGCLTVAVWASRHAGPVRAALLVTPPYLDPDWTPDCRESVDVFIDHVPREPLPFRSVLVASRNDPMTTFEQFEAYARDWGSELFDAGAVGHLDSKTGFGPWPAGERLCRSLASRGGNGS